MNIVFVNPVGAIGGAERALLTIMAAIGTAEPSFKIHLIVGTDGPLVATAKALGVQVKLLMLPDRVTQLGDSALKGKSQVTTVLMLLLRVAIILPAIGLYLVKFRQAIQEINPDLIHTNGIKAHLLTGLASINRVPVIWHIQDFYGTRPLMAQALRWMSDRATGGIAISEAVAQDARATLPRLPIEMIYSAVDVKHFSPGLANLSLLDIPSEKLTSDVNTIRVGIVATFARWKGHDIFLEAAAQVIRCASRIPLLAAPRPDLNVRFYIVGSPIYQTKGSQFSIQELGDKASALEIADKVDFIGFQQNIVEVYRWLDIVVHASTQPEPFGLAIIEAMACGKPVIVSQAGGAAELFTHNYDAVGIQPGDFAALASAIQHLIDNPAQRQRLSENARHTVLKCFSCDRLGQQILAAYRNLCSKQTKNNAKCKLYKS